MHDDTTWIVLRFFDGIVNQFAKSGTYDSRPNPTQTYRRPAAVWRILDA